MRAKIVALWLAAVALVAVFVWSVVLAVGAALSPSQAGVPWPVATGPIGDTFGGLLGPILNAAVLAATVFLAVSWQPRKEERDRASNVVGWIAETERGHLGVVVANTSGSVAGMVDVVVTRSDESDTTLIDREESLPPGSWFIPFGTVGPPLTTEWKLPVSVDTSQRMTVTLRSLDSARNTDSEELLLRPHLPQTQAGEHLPHFSIEELRYTLGGRTWARDHTGALHKAAVLSPTEDARRDDAMRTGRESIQPSTMSAKVTPNVEQLLRYTVDALCSDGAAEGTDVFDAAARTAQPVSPHVLPGVRTIARNANQGGTLKLTLEVEGRTLVLAQSKARYPGIVEVRDSNGEVVRAGAKKLSYFAQKAGARVVGGRRAFQVAQDAADWMQSPGWQALWIIALREMVVAASRPIDGAPADATKPAQAERADASAVTPS